MIPSICKKLAHERHDRELDSSYESSLQTYHRRYEREGIVYSTGFVDNVAFNNFIENYLKLVCHNIFIPSHPYIILHTINHCKALFTKRCNFELNYHT